MREKKSFHYSGIILISLICMFCFTSIRCEMDKCDETMEPQYYVDIRAEISITDGPPAYKPVEGLTVRIEMQKTHCDGKLGPLLNAEGITNADGIFEPYMTWSFKMNNLEDYITLKTSVNGGGINGSILDYNDLKQYSGSTYFYRENRWW